MAGRVVVRNAPPEAVTHVLHLLGSIQVQGPTRRARDPEPRLQLGLPHTTHLQPLQERVDPREAGVEAGRGLDGRTALVGGAQRLVAPAPNGDDGPGPAAARVSDSPRTLRASFLDIPNQSAEEARHQVRVQVGKVAGCHEAQGPGGRGETLLQARHRAPARTAVGDDAKRPFRGIATVEEIRVAAGSVRDHDALRARAATRVQDAQQEGHAAHEETRLVAAHPAAATAREEHEGAAALGSPVVGIGRRVVGLHARTVGGRTVSGKAPGAGSRAGRRRSFQGMTTEHDHVPKDEPLTSAHDAWRVEEGGARVERGPEEVAAEHPLTLVVNGRELATLVCSPSHLEELALGFLTAEGILRRGERIERFFLDAGRGRAVVEAPDRDAELEQALFGKRYVGSCCGKSRTGFYLANDARTARRVEADLRVDPATCLRLMEGLRAASPVFGRTGGVHNAGLATGGRLEVVRTDIGRHNTLDKLYGWALEAGLDLGERAIVFSGRISSEIVLKVAKMGCPVLVSKSAPTGLALQMADDLGITAAGFARGDRLNVYTHPQRILRESGTDGM